MCAGVVLVVAFQVAQDELEARLAHAAKENRGLHSQLQQARKATETSDARVNTLEHQLRAAHTATEKAQTACATKQSSIDGLRREISELKKTVTQLEQSREAALSAASAHETRQLAELARKKDSELASLTARLKVADKIVETTKAARSTISTKLGEARDEVAELKKQCEALQVQLKQRDETLAAVRREKEELQASSDLVTQELEEVVRSCITSSCCHVLCAA